MGRIDQSPRLNPHNDGGVFHNRRIGSVGVLVIYVFRGLFGLSSVRAFCISWRSCGLSASLSTYSSIFTGGACPSEASIRLLSSMPSQQHLHVVIEASCLLRVTHYFQRRHRRTKRTANFKDPSTASAGQPFPTASLLTRLPSYHINQTSICLFTTSPDLVDNITNEERV